MVYELYSRLRDYFSFSFRELREISLSAIFFGFILSFRKWGVSEFNISAGISNWIFATMVVFIAMYANISMQKIFALNGGYKMYYSWWFQGVLVGLFLSFITFGYFPFLYPGTSYFEHKKGLRLGRFRHGTNNKDMAVASIAGVVTNVVLALLAGFVYIFTESYWVMFFIMINFLYAFYAMIPMPKISGLKMSQGATQGFYIFFFARPLYVFIFSSLIMYSLLIYVSVKILGSFPLLIISMLLGLFGLFIFLKVIEKET